MLRPQMLASVAAVLPVAFANANAGSKLFVCATPQQADLDQAGFEALVWTQVKGVGNHGETGSSTNILTYDTWDTDVIQKAKGMTDAGSPEIELARIPTDPGQIILRNAALTNLNYAFKIERNDKPTTDPDALPTRAYNRGLITGPRTPNGRNEDFDLEVFTLGLNQRQLVVNPTAGGNAPEFTAMPAITGTAEVGETLSLSNGTVTGDATITYTYQWFTGGVPIPGATANTYEIQASDLGNLITGRVVASNSVGTAQGMSAPTAAVTNP